MTAATEAKLAREAGMAFACLAMVTDFDCWHPAQESVDVSQVMATANSNAKAVYDWLLAVLPKLASLGPSPWGNVLESAVMTAEYERTEEAQAMLEILQREFES